MTPGVAFAANVALEAPAGSTLTQAGEVLEDVASLLEERGHTVTVVSGADIDTLEEIQQFDTVVIGGSAFGEVDVFEFDAVLVEYVGGGGGLVVPGILYLIVDAGAPPPGLDTIAPTDPAAFAVGGGLIELVPGSEITDGLSDWNNTAFDILPGPIRDSAFALSTIGGELDSAAGEFEGGRVVTLGPLFTTEYSGGLANEFLLDGSTPDATEMFLRSIEWSAENAVAPEGCHDGVLDPGEICDDGNFSNTDDCVNPCVPASCGDHYVHAGVELCDDGDEDNNDACLVGCIPASCGDGFTRTGVEDCDDTNDDETDACLSTCEAASCGDGFLRAGVETCDDGNLDDSDDCPGSCQPAVCGDGYVLAGVEPCDDGNDVNDDDCLNGCIAPTCGDGFLQNGTEGCDDANDDNTDACVGATCQLASCGDGFVFAGFEACDDGNDQPGDGCTACQLDGDESSSGGESSSSGGESSTGGGSTGDSGGSSDTGDAESSDGGNTAGSSSGGGESLDSSGGDASTDAESTGEPAIGSDGGGCSCRSAGTTSTAPWWLVAVGLWRRRARRPTRR
jgi:cysteine-rich repeat protein